MLHDHLQRVYLMENIPFNKHSLKWYRPISLLPDVVIFIEWTWWFSLFSYRCWHSAEFWIRDLSLINTTCWTKHNIFDSGIVLAVQSKQHFKVRPVFRSTPCENENLWVKSKPDLNYLTMWSILTIWRWCTMFSPWWGKLMFVNVTWNNVNWEGSVGEICLYYYYFKFHQSCF